MQNSKAGKKLAPIIAAQTAPIYKTDPRRYQRLCQWVWWAQSNGWPDEAIAEALRMSQPAIHGADDFWRYLTKLLSKAKGRAHEDESAAHKSADMALAGEMVEFLRMRRARG